MTCAVSRKKNAKISDEATFEWFRELGLFLTVIRKISTNFGL
jgi:hypothetical protein